MPHNASDSALDISSCLITSYCLSARTVRVAFVSKDARSQDALSASILCSLAVSSPFQAVTNPF